MLRPAIAVARWSFRREALALALGVSIASYFPVLLGKVPLPIDWLKLSAPWEMLPALQAPLQPHAELGDLISLMYPFRSYLSQAFRSGNLPYWNPHTFLGSPFLANPISAAFYPPNWLFLFLPAPLAWSLAFPLRTGLAAFFAALLSRRVGASRAGAILCGLVFSLSGFMTGWQGWPQADCLLWAPLILLCMVEAQRQPTPRKSALLAVTLVMPLLAGHPEVCLYTLALAGAYGLFLLVTGARRRASGRWALKYVGTLALGGGLAVGLAAVQLIPSFEWASQITRRLEEPWGPKPTRDLVALLSRDAQSNPNPAGLSVPELCCYAGVGTLVLVPLAFIGRRRNRRVAIFFAVVGAVALEITFGLFPASEIFRSLPLVRALPGNRLIGVVDLCLALLAGFGLSSFQRTPRSHLLPLVVLVATALCLTVGIGALQSRLTDPGRLPALRSPASAGAFLIASLALVASLMLRRRSGLGAVTAVLIVLIAVDLVSFSWGHVPFVDAKAVFPDGELFRFLKKQTTRYDRVLFLHGTGPWNVEMVYGLYTVAGYPQVLRSTARLLSPLNGGSESDEPLRPFRAQGVASANPQLMDLLGIRWVVATTYNEKPESQSILQKRFPNWIGNQSLQVYENPSALPVAYLAPAETTPLEWLAPAHGTAVVPETSQKTTPLPRRDELGPSRGDIRNLQLKMNNAIGEARVDVPSALVMTQTWYPGWRARLDGKETPLLRAYGNFCAMIVPAGTHRFEFAFSPSHFRLATAISIMSLCVITGLVGFGGRRPPEAERGQPKRERRHEKQRKRKRRR